MHEHLDAFGIINMNGRVYDPLTAMFFSPDPFVQAPGNWLNYNRYGYAFGNPLVYIDPDGELAWFVPILIGAVIFGTGNLVAHTIRGDVNSFGDGLKYFGQGALAGAALGTAWQFAPLIPIVGKGIQTTMTVYGIAQGITGVAGMVGGAINDGSDGLGRAGKLFLGNFYLNEKDPWLGVWQGFTRHTWEMPQSWLGQTVSQVLNTSGITDKVEYWGGATFSTTRDQSIAVSIGSYINVRTQPYTDFDSYILTDQTVMHEYGHTFDSRIWGPLYLFVIGLPSLISADASQPIYHSGIWTTTHRLKWYERSASRKAKKYFNKHGVIWNDIRNPTYK
jgi:RHS repeat-associated protein